jgi:hypothetical protein
VLTVEGRQGSSASEPTHPHCHTHCLRRVDVAASECGWLWLETADGAAAARRECATPSRSTVPVSRPRVLLESTTQGPRVVQVEQNCWGGGNAERQCYVDSPRNVWVEGGALHLRVLPGAHMGSLVGCTSNEENSCTWTQPFTSARINSKASAGTVSPARYARRNMHRAECSGPPMCIQRPRGPGPPAPGSTKSSPTAHRQWKQPCS